MKRFCLLLAVIIIAACGGGGGGGSSTGGGGGNSGVNLNVNNASLGFGQTLNLVATVPGVSSQTVTWTSTGGTITPTGASTATYTAPGVAGTYTITARSAAEPTKTGTVVVNVSQVGVTIDPTATTLGLGKSTLFTVNVTGATNTTANLTATGGSVTRIDANHFTYTAPNTAGNYTLTGSAQADSTKKATAKVTVANLGSNATVTGAVRVDGTVNGVPNVSVAFYDASGVELGRVSTGADGKFSATVPATAKRFGVVGSTLQPGYYAQFSYGALRYSGLITTCTAPLPTLTAGNTVALPASIYVNQASEPPPPPPNGCPL